MHPEIEKFWSNSGYYIVNSWGMYFAHKSLDAPGFLVANRFNNKELKLTYIFNKIEFSERDMLKIIKLKLFI